MADQQNAPSGFVHPSPYHAKDIGLGGDIQHGGSLVQDQQLWLKQKNAGNGNPLGFSP